MPQSELGREIFYGAEARKKLKAGVDKLANAVKVTLGPKGRNVLYENTWGGQTVGAPASTKDGVTVAKEIRLTDRVENIGAQIVKEVAAKTMADAGDGTTTATLLAQEIFSEGLKALDAGASPVQLKRGMDQAVETVVSLIRNQALPLDTDEAIYNVAFISCNGDAEMADIVTKAMKKVGKDGVVTVENGKSTHMEIETVEGIKIDSGWVTPQFFTNPEKMLNELDNPYILFYGKKIQSIQEIFELGKKVNQAGRHFLIISEDISVEPLSMLLQNHQNGSLRSCVIKAPGFGDNRRFIMEDLADACGGTYITDETGFKLDKISLEHLGQAEKVVTSQKHCVIMKGKGWGGKIQVKVKALQNKLAELKDGFEKDQVRDRLARLTGGIAVIYAGAPTEPEIKEKKDRLDDAIHAVRAAMEEGIVEGGGMALLKANFDSLSAIDASHQRGIEIIKKILSAPFEQICRNAGKTPEVILSKLGPSEGYDASMDLICNMREKGIIDPAKVVRCALQNAVSVASLLLTTETVIVDSTDYENKKGVLVK